MYYLYLSGEFRWCAEGPGGKGLAGYHFKGLAYEVLMAIWLGWAK